MNSNILIKLIKFGSGFILFIPLYVGGSFFFPFIFPKIWLFGLVTEIIFFLYVILAISDNRYRPKINLVFWALALLTLVLVITSFTGIDPFRSFWGNTERMSGVIYWLHFAAFAVILSGVLKSGKEWKNFFGIAVFVSILEFFYVLAQYLNVSWTWLPGSQMGTIGNTDLDRERMEEFFWHRGFCKYFGIFLCFSAVSERFMDLASGKSNGDHRQYRS